MNSVRITRDSVCAGDDLDPPHERSLHLDAGEGVRELVEFVAGSGYLASIAGGKATWVAVADGTPVAVVAQQWTGPRMLEPIAIKVPAEVHFIYRAQDDPGRVFNEVGATLQGD